MPPSSAQIDAFRRLVDEVDPSVPICAAYLVCVGRWLVDAAIDFYHSAVAHAPPGAYRRDCPPGLKSAEATRSWLDTHLDAVKTLAASTPGRPKAPYGRPVELRRAVALAGDELCRSLGAARQAGLWFDERLNARFAEAAEDLTAVTEFVTRREAT
jgi:hypothetical protein